MEVHPYSYFRWCGYFQGPWVSFVVTDEFSVRVTKITSRIGVSWTQQPTVKFCNLFLTQWIMAILLKGCKPDNFQPRNSLKLLRIFKNLFHFCQIWIFPWIKLSWHSCSTWDKLEWLNWFWQFLCERLSSFNPKNSITHMYGLAVYVKEGLPFGLISRKLFRFLLMFFTRFTSLSVSSIDHLLRCYVQFLTHFI